MREIDGMMVSGYYYRLLPIVSGYSILLDWLRNLRLIKIVDSPAQLTVTRWKLISSHPASHSLHRSRILRECHPESDGVATIVFWCRKSFSGIRFEAQAGYTAGLEKLYYLAFTRNATAAEAVNSRVERIGLATRTQANAGSDVHFMGRHVVSVQWRKVWFFPGNFGLFNRDPISDSPGLPSLVSSRNSHAFPSNRSSLFRFALFLRRFITSLVLLRKALFR